MTVLEQSRIDGWLGIAPRITELMGQDRYFLDYDDKADVLYLSFKRPQKATDSEMLDNGVIIRYRDEEIVGITILDASKREKQK